MLPNRFMAKTETRNQCLIWTAALGHNGYGIYEHDGKTSRAHRVAYELVKGPIPAGLVIDHLCRNRACVNPEHLEAVTPKENIQRGNTGKHLKDRTHCKHGHALTEDNIYWRKRANKNPYRECRTCKQDAWRRWCAKLTP